MEKYVITIEKHKGNYATPWEIEKEIFHDVETGDVFGAKNDFFETKDEAINEAIRVLQSLKNHAPKEAESKKSL